MLTLTWDIYITVSPPKAQSCCTYKLIDAVTACTTPAQTQASQNPNMEGGGGHEVAIGN